MITMFTMRASAAMFCRAKCRWRGRREEEIIDFNPEMKKAWGSESAQRSFAAAQSPMRHDRREAR